MTDYEGPQFICPNRCRGEGTYQDVDVELFAEVRLIVAGTIRYYDDGTEMNAKPDYDLPDRNDLEYATVMREHAENWETNNEDRVCRTCGAICIDTAGMSAEDVELTLAKQSANLL